VTRSFQEDPIGTAIDFPEGPIGVRDQIAVRTISATGLGDVSLRAKFAPVQRSTRGFGVAVDVKVPTGNEDNLLGVGKASARLIVIGSTTVASRLSAYGNAGYTAGGASDEVNYVFGADMALGSRKQLTVAASVIGQTIKDGVELEKVNTLNVLGNGGVRTTYDRQFVSRASQQVLHAAIGAKLQVKGRWLVNASVLIPVNDAGFRGGVTPIVGLDYTWTPKKK
jgi:hypothetical protein